MIFNLPGLNSKFLILLKKRFELTFFCKSKEEKLIEYQARESKSITQPLNIIFSQINTVNNVTNDLKNLNIIRLYLIKSYRGRCHAIGKPVRGQRTWSNAWNSFNVNKSLRNFIGETRKQMKKTNLPEKINYKVIKKKYANSSKKVKKVKSKKILWF